MKLTLITEDDDFEILTGEQQFEKDKADHGAIKAVRNRSKGKGYSARDLTVLSPQNDPFRLDTPANHRNGKWLAQQIERFISSEEVHLRGLHYRLIGNVWLPVGDGLQSNALHQ
jgi:hypothetical protein